MEIKLILRREIKKCGHQAVLFVRDYTHFSCTSALLRVVIFGSLQALFYSYVLSSESSIIRIWVLTPTFRRKVLPPSSGMKILVLSILTFACLNVIIKFFAFQCKVLKIILFFILQITLNSQPYSFSISIYFSVRTGGTVSYTSVIPYISVVLNFHTCKEHVQTDSQIGGLGF